MSPSATQHSARAATRVQHALPDLTLRPTDADDELLGADAAVVAGGGDALGTGGVAGLAGDDAADDYAELDGPETYNAGHILDPNDPNRVPMPTLPTSMLQPEPVPEAVTPPPMPLTRLIMPLVMILLLAGMVALMVLGSGEFNPMMLIFPLMMATSFIGMTGVTGSGDLDTTRRLYLRHLAYVRDNALYNAALQRDHADFHHPKAEHLLTFVSDDHLWRRNKKCDEFLRVRVGFGNTTLCTPVDRPQSGSPEDLDPVCAVSLRHLVDSIEFVEEMPLTIDLTAYPTLGIIGPHGADLARAIVADLAFHHGPDDVHIRPMGRGWDWTVWLPHTREPEEDFHPIVIDIIGDIETPGPVPGTEDGRMVGGFTGYSSRPKITAADSTADITIEVLEVTEYTEHNGLVLHASDDGLFVVLPFSDPERIGEVEGLSSWGAMALARRLSGYRRPSFADSNSAHDILELAGVGSAATLKAENLWRKRRSQSERLLAPIGHDGGGGVISLDLKESAQGGMGPHGLCIGATGSGKSELLRTLVVSLAATHSPQELNFVLVDFKGGATFLGLDNLPHTSAVITNLDQEAVLVDRMHAAISGEMKRRQELLRAKGNFANVDAYNQDARAKGEEPLPALVIILDEFSELLGQHPDFADLFVAVGRLGRSLHVHLLLASQRLDEGRLRGLDSHLSYRIGLRTFSAAESRQVLGVPDAYQLPNQPGAGYLKTSSDNPTRFRASYVSGPSQSRTHLPKREPSLIFAAQWRDQIKPDEVVVEGPSIVEVLVAAAAERAKELGLSAHQMWLPPLPDRVPLTHVVDSPRELSVVLGKVDRPEDQRQDPYLLDFSGSGGHIAICGGPQSGKTHTLTSLVLAIAATHHSDSHRIYVVDAAAGQLGWLAGLPHVAGVAIKGEAEKIRRIVAEVYEHMLSPGPGHTYLIVDGWHALIGDFEDLNDTLSSIASDGLSSRVHLILTTPRWNVMRPVFRDAVGTRIELKLGEAMDSVVDRKLQAAIPAAPGRGLHPDGSHLLVADSDETMLPLIVQLAKNRGCQQVPPLRMLPAETLIHRATAEEYLQSTPPNLRAQAKGAIIPLGVGGTNLGPVAWYPETSLHLLIIGGPASGKSQAIATVARGVCALGAEQARIVMLDPRREHLATLPEEMLAIYAGTQDTMREAVNQLCVTLRSRMPGPDVTPEELRSRSWWSGPELYLIIDDDDLLPDGLLFPLKEFIPHARDIGLHIVMARKAGGISRTLYGPLHGAIKDTSPAVILFDIDKDEGTLFGVRPAKRIPGRAALVTRGIFHSDIHIGRYPEGPPDP